MSGCQPIVFGTAMLRRVQLQEERNVYSSGAQKQGSISVGAAQHMSLLQSFSRFFNVFAINVSPLRGWLSSEQICCRTLLAASPL